MSQIIKDWLSDKLTNLISIQAVTQGGPADLVVHAWSGVKVLVYMIGEPVKTRAIKRTLHDATYYGLNTLFLVDSRLLPPDGQRFKADEWMLAIHTLTGERIYAYQLNQDGPVLYQVHLEHFSATNEHEAWHGPAIRLDRMRFFRTSVKPRFIKGEWLVADFDAPAFWKHFEYQQKRHRQRRDDKRTGQQTSWQTWSGYQTWAGESTSEQPNTRANGPIGVYLEECYAILGVEADADQKAIKAAFRKRAITYHPDTSELPAEEAEARFRALNAAYEYIKTAKGWS